METVPLIGDNNCINYIVSIAHGKMIGRFGRRERANGRGEDGTQHPVDGARNAHKEGAGHWASRNINLLSKSS